MAQESPQLTQQQLSQARALPKGTVSEKVNDWLNNMAVQKKVGSKKAASRF
jgi:hypothetical protein